VINEQNCPNISERNLSRARQFYVATILPLLLDASVFLWRFYQRRYWNEASGRFSALLNNKRLSCDAFGLFAFFMTHRQSPSSNYDLPANSTFAANVGS
jgi:hypothetical protein